MFTPHNMSHVMCHILSVTCHMSHVICHVSHVTFFLTSGEAYWWIVCYQQGLSRLVLLLSPQIIVYNLLVRIPLT